MRQIFLRKSKRSISKLIFHHFGDHPPAGMNAAKVRALHMKPKSEGGNGWKDGGYHGVIMPDGEFQIIRDVDTMGAHAYPHNRGSIGIMFVSGIKKGHSHTKPTEAQLNTARLICEEQKRYYPKTRNFPGLKILGHGDVANTFCPGFDVPHWYKTNEIRPMRHR